MISLDFELHWGVRDREAVGGAYGRALLGARAAILQMLDLFEEYGTAATWATVGFLFAGNREEVESLAPSNRPKYRNPLLNPYLEAIGTDEQDDPFHFAASLIDRISKTPRQEIGTHTFSHFYCSQSGATPEAFHADLCAAQRIAGSIPLRSIVFPRNQIDPRYLSVLREVGIEAYRGNPPGPLWVTTDGTKRWRARLGRLLDTYWDLTGDDTTGWGEVVEPGGLANVRASRFLRPFDPRLSFLEPLRFRRIAASLERAARHDRIYHLWWHPHNFGWHTAENLGFLRRVMDVFARLRETEGMESLSMGDVAARVRTP